MENGTYLIEMGKKIKAARKAKKVSYPALGKLTGMNISSLWFIENGERNAHILTLKNIADVLEVDVKDFICFE
jgi:transcriptional regulator with XRE-family HTH domain